MLTHNSRGYSSPGRSVARHIVCVVMKLREMDSGAQLVSPSNPVQDSSPWIGAAHVQSDSSHLNGQSLETPSQTCQEVCVHGYSKPPQVDHQECHQRHPFSFCFFPIFIFFHF